MITLRVDGEPAPQGSKSVGRHGGVYEKSRKVKPWREAIRAAALAQGVGPVNCAAVAVGVVFMLPRPKGHYGTGRNADRLRDSAPLFPATRPDLDKLARSTLDGLMLAGIYADDGQVIALSAEKMYAGNGSPPGAAITIREYMQ